MPPRGPALTFDPRYVTAAIDAWRACNLEPIALSDLEREIARLMRERFIAWNIMGMREQTVSASSVTKAIGVFPALKLARRTTRGRGEARVTIITPTLGGRDVLAEEPIGGALYPRFAEYLSNASADITSLLNLLAQHGPLTQPVLHVLPEAPRRGAAYQAAIKEGWAMTGVRQPLSIRRILPMSQLAQADTCSACQGGPILGHASASCRHAKATR